MDTINPLLITIPESFETERLTIRAPQFGDGAMVHEAICESIEQLRPWMPWAQDVPTMEQSEIGVRQARVHFLDRSDLRLYLIHKDSGKLVGCSGLHRIDWQARKFEIGDWVSTSYSGLGYITEAVQGIANFAIDQLEANRLEIRCDSINHRSIQVAQRSGFTLEGILRRDECRTDGVLMDTMIFARVRGVEFGV
ncbi:GNAT family protein [Paenibacillus sp. RC67]|uniref:GNAT family N-acetyltransferase n=1 Tax=Paenibacillus sp. RC67 TaxID=3039392 RepID=UPI0024AD97FA|nr:GNAT family protein [Paenibacillus sp. RC67]